MCEYVEIKKLLKDIEMKRVTINDSHIHNKLALLRVKNFSMYENFLIKYNKVLENLVINERDNIVNILLEKVSDYGESSLSKSEKELLIYYSN